MVRVCGAAAGIRSAAAVIRPLVIATDETTALRASIVWTRPLTSRRSGGGAAPPPRAACAATATSAPGLLPMAAAAAAAEPRNVRREAVLMSSIPSDGPAESGHYVPTSQPASASQLVLAVRTTRTTWDTIRNSPPHNVAGCTRRNVATS